MLTEIKEFFWGPTTKVVYGIAIAVKDNILRSIKDVIVPILNLQWNIEKVNFVSVENAKISVVFVWLCNFL